MLAWKEGIGELEGCEFVRDLLKGLSRLLWGVIADLLSRLPAMLDSPKGRLNASMKALK